MKRKSNYSVDVKKVNQIDVCLTPWYGVEPLLPYLPNNLTIWESACGDNYITDYLRLNRYAVINTDLHSGYDFFKWKPEQSSWDIQVTNPPYGMKYPWLERSYELGKPFALLLPVETIGAQKAQKLAKQHGAEFLFLDKRIDFKMPYKGFDCSAQFPVMWWCWNLLPNQINFATLNKPKVEEVKKYYDIDR